MLTIVRARDADVAAMHDLQMRAFDEEGRRCGTRDIPPLQESIASVAEHVRTQLALVAREDGRIVGCVRGLREGRACRIRALVVDPSRHGRGFGSALLRALEAELADVDRIVLTTNTIMEANVPFYERHGYRVVETTTPVPGITLAQMAKSVAGAA
jgi:tRNA (guanine37-N1)-methyltransferase